MQKEQKVRQSNVELDLKEMQKEIKEIKTFQKESLENSKSKKEEQSQFEWGSEKNANDIISRLSV